MNRSTHIDPPTVSVVLTREDLDHLVNEQTLAMNEDISGMRVDRKFLDLNFRWSRRRVESLEASGMLKPVFTGDAKSKYYSLRECFRIRNELKKMLRP